MNQHAPRAFAVKWQDVERWSPSSFNELPWRWPVEAIYELGYALKRRSEVVDKSESPISELRFGSIHFDGEISIRNMSGKVEVKGQLFKASPNDVVFSQIDARNGAIGIVPPDSNGYVFSSEFPIYSVDKATALPEYIKLVFRSDAFQRQINSVISGASGRKRVQPKVLESIQIPLPTPPTQRAIVAHWQSARENANEVESQCQKEETKLQKRFLDELGLPTKTAPITKRAFAMNWKDVEQWGIESIRRIPTIGEESSKFPTVRLSEVIDDLTNGWSPKCLSRPVQKREWGVLKLGAVSFGVYNENENKALSKNMKPRESLKVNRGDVLFVRGNVLRLTGACCYVPHVSENLMLPDLIFRAVFKKESKIQPRFLSEIMSTPYLRAQIESVATGSSPTMKKVTKPALLALRFPLPPLKEQKRMVKYISHGRDRIDDARKAAQGRLKQTAEDIEQMILGHMPVPKTRC